MVAEQHVVMERLQKIVQIFVNSEGEIRPHFMLTGPSGSGKSHLIQQLAEDFEINFLEVNAAQITKEGTSGNSISKALGPLLNFQSQPTICFVDEFDKLFISGNSNSDCAHETTNGVQNEFLKILEGDTTQVFGDYGKYISCSVENVLFVFAGAFNGTENIDADKLREFGVKTEFLGRVGLFYHLEKPSIDSMRQVLENSSLLEKYLGLFPKVKRSKVIKEIMTVVEREFDKNTLGVRMLSTLMHQYFITGKLGNSKDTKKITFQKTMDLGD